ncbi:MAG: TrkH family potassium uptake protein [Candidatus Thermoplasmatota archaeon]|nr:TrkH family potassium uptake protein [Candidatus Thermoplasmatota archaeon]
MRYDVLNLILGWTLLALLLPLALCGAITWWLDGWVLAAQAFLPAMLISGGLGAIMLGLFTRTDSAQRLRDLEAFVGVGLVWPLTVLIGALPYWFGGVFVGPFVEDALAIDIMRGFVNSWFESMSGFTTSGATVLSHSMSPNCIPGTTPDCINAQPQGLLLWRSLTQWLGGMGVVMLGMLVLSRIIGGGMALARAELTGPSLSRLRPKLRQTAMALWGLYLLLTLVEMLALKFIGGMTVFDSVNHAFTTMPSGGFSTRDASIAYYDSATIELIIIVFMFLAGVNFTLMWLFGAGDFKAALKDEEFRTYLLYITAAVLVIVTSLVLVGMALGHALLDTLFHVLSIGTSTGYASANYADWPGVARIILLLLMIVGACAGSTSGGLKLMRIRIGLKVAFRELARIAQPRKIHMIRMNKEVVEDKQVSLVVGMLFIWVILFGFSCIVLGMMMPDASFETIFSVAASGLGNTGPALGAYGPTETWASMNSGSLLFTSVLMWFGRLELLTAIIVLHPHSWRREEKSDGERQGMAMVKRILDREGDED